MSATMHDVLAEALECAVADRLEDDLAEVRFGKFSDSGAGWYWIATFKREAGSHPSVAKHARQSLRRRIGMVIAAWEAERARYTEKAEA